MPSSTQPNINPNKITKPYQLLGGLVVFGISSVAAFLTAAVKTGGWQSDALIVAAIVYTPVFFCIIAFMQTHFREQLLDDSNYIKIKSKKTDDEFVVSARDIVEINSLSRPSERLNVIEASNKDGCDWSNWKIALNVLFPEWISLKSDLERQAIPIAVPFGSSVSALPNRWIVSINEAMPISCIVSILKIIRKYNFDGFSLWTPNVAYGELEDVYIGAFGVEKFTKLDSEIDKILEENLDEFKFRAYVLKHTG